jgi:hypothetical protein
MWILRILLMTRDEVEDLKYSIDDIRRRIEAAGELVGKVGCIHETNIARAMIEFNQLINIELERGRLGALK